MEPQVAPLAALYDLNTDLLLNCLDGLSDAEAQRRLEAGGNSITFLAGHLTDTRHFLVARLGHTLANPLAETVLAGHGFSTDLSHLSLHGICGICRAKERASGSSGGATALQGS